jgi:hypothetical protein
MIISIANPRTKYGDMWYVRMSKKTCCGNAIVEWLVGTMQGK